MSSAASSKQIPVGQPLKGQKDYAEYPSQAGYRRSDHVHLDVWGGQFNWNLETGHGKIQDHAAKLEPEPTYESHGKVGGS